MPVVAAIRRWLEGAFPESNVRLEDDQANNLSRFLIEERTGGRARVFEVSSVALRSDPDGVVRYLSDQGVAGRLRNEPTWRARLHMDDMLEYFQQMHVRCDGKSYYILQTADRKVYLMDAKHRPLVNTPASPAAFDGDITSVPASEWHQKIRQWRAVDQ